MASPLTTASALLAHADLKSHAAIVGLDGFVDQILRVVQSKHSASHADYFPTIAALSERIAAAAGKSAALEMHLRQTKLGGNGPIMANALAALGLPLTYVGAVGQDGGLHPVFAPMAAHATVIPVCEAARTDALEFDDGKLMLQRMECLDNLDFACLEQGVGGPAKLRALFNAADFVALNHWSSLPHLTDIWRRLQAEVCPTFKPGSRQLFVDLADTRKRSAADLRAAFAGLAAFEPWYAVTLGVNEGESEHLAEVLGCEPKDHDHRARTRARAVALRAAIGISCVTVHPVAFAAAADARGSALVDGPFTAKPKISTGAGDHFNAGFCLGKLLHGDLASCLQLGVATSGYYVRTAVSPTIPLLHAFLGELAVG